MGLLLRGSPGVLVGGQQMTHLKEGTYQNSSDRGHSRQEFSECWGLDSFLKLGELSVFSYVFLWEESAKWTQNESLLIQVSATLRSQLKWNCPVAERSRPCGWKFVWLVVPPYQCVTPRGTQPEACIHGSADEKNQLGIHRVLLLDAQPASNFKSNSLAI